MQHLRTYVAMTATAAALALGHNAFAQDDLDDLLADLEGNAPFLPRPRPQRRHQPPKRPQQRRRHQPPKRRPQRRRQPPPKRPQRPQLLPN